MKRGLSTYVFGDGLLDPSNIASLRERSIDAVEIWSAAPHFTASDRERLLEVRRSLAQGGLAVHSFHIGFQDGAKLCSENDLMRRIAVQTTIENLNVAAAFDADWLVIHTDNGGEPASDRKKASDALMISMTELLREAELVEVGVALDTSPRGREPDLGAQVGELRNICACYPGFKVGICLSTSHFGSNGELVDAVRTAGPFLVSTHVAYNGVGQRRPDPAQGVADWRPFIDALRELNYSGPCMLEAGTDEPIGKCIDRINSVFSRLGL